MVWACFKERTFSMTRFLGEGERALESLPFESARGNGSWSKCISLLFLASVRSKKRGRKRWRKDRRERLCQLTEEEGGIVVLRAWDKVRRWKGRLVEIERRSSGSKWDGEDRELRIFKYTGRQWGPRWKLAIPQLDERPKKMEKLFSVVELSLLLHAGCTMQQSPWSLHRWTACSLQQNQ